MRLFSVERRPWPERGFVALAWPSLVENVLLTTMGIISMMMVARLGAAAMAGVGAANQVMNLLIVVFSGLSVGTTALVARRVGAGDRAGARTTLGQSLGLGILLGLAVAVLGVAAADPVLRLMGAAPEVAREGATYLRGVMASTPLLAVMLIGNGSLRGSGDTRTPMGITAVANAANVVVAYPLIFGIAGLPSLGVAGAACGVAAARLVGCYLVLRSLGEARSVSPLDLLRKWRPDASVLRPLASIGGPAAGEFGSIQLGMMLFSLIVISLGTSAFAAQQIVFNAANLSMMPGMAFSVAATTLVGQALGASSPSQAERSGWMGALSAAGWMSAMGAVFVIFPEQICALYTSDPEVVRLGAIGLRVVGFGQPLQGVAFALAGALRGAGDTRTTFRIATVSMWIIRLPVAYVLGVLAGLAVTGVWLGWVSDWSFRSVLYGRAFRRGAWKALRVQ